jgi:hypothetical protein
MPSRSFQKKLDTSVEQMRPQDRERTSKNIQQLLNNGVTSFKALVQCVIDESEPLEVRVTACWLPPRLKPTARQQEQIADALLKIVNHHRLR